MLSHDLRDETRWPRWGRLVTDALGLEAVLSIVVRRDDRSFGALNLYSAEPRGLSTVNLARLHLLGIRLAADLFEVRLAGAPAADRAPRPVLIALGRSAVGSGVDAGDSVLHRQQTGPSDDGGNPRCPIQPRPGRPPPVGR